MIISEKQVLLMLTILRDTFSYLEIDGAFSISREDRRKLYQDVLNQQSEE